MADSLFNKIKNIETVEKYPNQRTFFYKTAQISINSCMGEADGPVKYTIETHNTTHNLQNVWKEKEVKGDMRIKLSPGYKLKEGS